MKQKSLIITFMLIFSCVLSYSQDRGLKILAKQLDQNIQIEKQYLLIIGIDKYEYWMPLKNPVRDAKKISDILTSRYHINEVI